MSADKITVLTTRGPALAKTWNADGTITGHQKAKHHTVESIPVNNLREAAAVMESLRPRFQSCIVRGEYIGDEEAAKIDDAERMAGFVRRAMLYFRDVPQHVLHTDIDKYAPLFEDPAVDPLAAIHEFIRFSLPAEFHEASFHWALSGSAGHPSKAGTLNAHLTFWTTRKMSSAEMHAYATMLKLPLDRAFFHPVQATYTSDPVFAPGVVDPVPVRSGFYEGLFGDEVDLQIDEGALTAAMLETRRVSSQSTGETHVDPRQKHGVVGAFCRAFSVEDVLFSEWFPSRFEQVSDRRYTWLDGNGSAEGAFITEDGLKLVNTHHTAPCNTIGKGLNAYDLTRVYKFGALDEAVPEEDRWSWDDARNKPSEQAMASFAKILPQVQAELDRGPDGSNPFGGDEPPDEPPEETETPPAQDMADLGIPAAPVATAEEEDRRGLGMGKKIGNRLRAMGLTPEEVKELIDGGVLKRAWQGVFYRAENRSIYLLNRDGDLVQFGQQRWASVVSSTFGAIVRPDVLETVSNRLAGTVEAKPADIAKEILKAAWAAFEEDLVLYRQRGEMTFEVDIFTEKSTISIEPSVAAVSYVHKPFAVVPDGLPAGVAEAIVAEYKTHFIQFDDFIKGLLASRFASDRRQAFLWMKCDASWGKGFLIDGVLGRDGLGLTCAASVPEIENAFEGKPVGISVNEIVRSWMLVVDEFKSAKGDIKMLNSRIIIAPKNQMRATLPLYFKLFTSAEGVGSLAGDAGVEQQFADRFGLMEGEKGASINNLPLFKQYGKAAYRRVIANYTAGELNRGVDEMRRLGRSEATRQADVWLADFHKRYAIANTYGSLALSLPDLAAEFKQLLLDWAAREAGLPSRRGIDALKRDLKDALSQQVSVFAGAQHAKEETRLMVDVRRLNGLVRTWIECTIDRSQRAMVAYKAGEIAELISGVPNQRAQRHYVHEGEQCRAEVVKGGVVLELLQPADYQKRQEAFPAMEDKVVNINSRREA